VQLATCSEKDRYNFKYVEFNGEAWPMTTRYLREKVILFNGV